MTVGPRVRRLLIEAMAKHLPPSASRLRLLDVSGDIAEQLSDQRADLDVISVDGPPESWSLEPGSVDAVIALDYPVALDGEFLSVVLSALRPGGRLIMVDSNAEPGKAQVRALEGNGYVRLLVETAAECPMPVGTLMRGEKAHATDNTFARIRKVASEDADDLDLANYEGPYVFLLVAQSPNKPVWKLEPGETITWDALALEADEGQVLLAFTSLPKAVGFMQPVVMQGRAQGVSKVGKFSTTTAHTWELPVLLNPPVRVLDGQAIALVSVDPTTAEAPDE